MPPVKPSPPVAKKPTLAEQYLASAKRIDPEGVDAILRARIAAAGLVEEGSTRVSDLEEFKRILTEEFDKAVKVTDSIADGLTIDDMRKKGHATALRLAGSPAVDELLGVLSEDGVRNMARMMIHGRDGVMGIASQVAMKYPGTWRLASYMMEEDFHSVTRYLHVKQSDGTEAETRVDAPSGKVLKIYVELIETSGAPAPKYENGRIVGTATSGNPELVAATEALTEAIREMRSGPTTTQPTA